MDDENKRFIDLTFNVMSLNLWLHFATISRKFNIGKICEWENISHAEKFKVSCTMYRYHLCA